MFIGEGVNRDLSAEYDFGGTAGLDGEIASCGEIISFQ